MSGSHLNTSSEMPTKTVGAGQAIRIITGAPIPKGADTVLKVEDTEPTPDSVRVFKPEQKGANIRPQGEDVKKGERIISKGTRIRPGEAGMLAILAKSFVFAYQRPRVAILSTGDELADLDERFSEEKIINSNSYGLAAAVQDAGASLQDTSSLSADSIEAAVQSVVDATTTLASDVQDLGRPDTEAGQEAQVTVSGLSDTLEGDAATLLRDAGALSLVPKDDPTLSKHAEK